MNALKDLFHDDGRCFDLLEAATAGARDSVNRLVELLGAPDPMPPFEALIQARRKSQEVRDELDALFSQTFVTPLDREDVEALSAALAGIPSAVQVLGERALLCRSHLPDAELAASAGFLGRAAECVAQMVVALRSRDRHPQVRELNGRLHDLGVELDGIVTAQVRRMQGSRTEPALIALAFDLHEAIDRVMSRLREAAAVVVRIVLTYA